MLTETTTRKQIWIVDDEKDLADSYAEFLSDEYTPTVFSSPKEALTAWDKESKKPDLVISDLKMPEIDGLSFIEKARDKGLNDPVLMISGFAEKDDVLKAQNLHVDGFLEKPFEPEKLRKAIQQAITTESAKKIDQQLLTLFQQERTQYEDLISTCLHRYAHAENLADEAGVLLSDMNRRSAFLKTLYGENKMHRNLDEIQKEIDTLLKIRKELS